MEEYSVCDIFFVIKSVKLWNAKYMVWYFFILPTSSEKKRNCVIIPNIYVCAYVCVFIYIYKEKEKLIFENILATAFIKPSPIVNKGWTELLLGSAFLVWND